MAVAKRHSASLAALLLLSLHSFAPALAQNPLTTSAAAYTTIDERTFYVQGGFTLYDENRDPSLPAMDLTDQFFSLDLTTDWKAANPPWKAVPANSPLRPPRTWGHSMTAIKGNNDLLIWSTRRNPDSREGIYSFSIANNFWEPTVVPLPSTYNTWYKLKAAADPQTNDVYLPCGRGAGRSMAVYKTASSVGEETPMPPPETLIADVFGYTTLWSTFRNSMLLYGGLSYNETRVFNPSLVEFIPGNKTWARIVSFPAIRLPPALFCTGHLPLRVSTTSPSTAYYGNVARRSKRTLHGIR